MSNEPFDASLSPREEYVFALSATWVAWSQENEAERPTLGTDLVQFLAFCKLFLHFKSASFGTSLP